MEGVRVRPSPKLKSYMLQSQKIKKKKKTTKLLQDREDKQSLKKQKREKKRGSCNAVVADMTLHGSVCLLTDLLRTSDENAK